MDNDTTKMNSEKLLDLKHDLLHTKNMMMKLFEILEKELLEAIVNGENNNGEAD